MSAYTTKKVIIPDHKDRAMWEDYSQELMTEYNQSIEEGLDIEKYKDLFEAVAKIDMGEEKAKLSNVIFDIVSNAHVREGYKYNEPSDLESIKVLRKAHNVSAKVDKDNFHKQMLGAWIGRIAGCYLGKPVEGIRTKEFWRFLKASGNYPLQRYIVSGDLTEEAQKDNSFKIRPEFLADKITKMPYDDDTNYMIIGKLIVERCTRDFKSCDMMWLWREVQGPNPYCTAERVAFRNFLMGYFPPKSAIYKNPYREWIGAQIRGDYFGYICPGNPEKAAEMAYNDACISHIKNGIYGEMWVSSMLAVAAQTTNMKDIIFGGLAQIPATSRLYESVSEIVSLYDSGKTYDEVISHIHSVWTEHTTHGWCHTISNAMIVTAALLFGEGDYGKSICMAVQPGFDTDCNGATVGSVVGMAYGIDGIDEKWYKLFNDTLETTIFGVGDVKISECAKESMKYVEF